VTELKIEGYLAPWRNGARLNERGYPNFKAGEVLSATEYLDKQWSQCPVARRARDLRIVVRNTGNVMLFFALLMQAQPSPAPLRKIISDHLQDRADTPEAVKP
jgi:hypothetical protein